MCPVHAHIATIDGLSGHADRNDLLRWFRGFERPPARVFIVHGEPHQAQALATTLGAEKNCQAMVAKHGQRVDLLT